MRRVIGLMALRLLALERIEGREKLKPEFCFCTCECGDTVVQISKEEKPIYWVLSIRVKKSQVTTHNIRRNPVNCGKQSQSKKR